MAIGSSSPINRGRGSSFCFGTARGSSCAPTRTLHTAHIGLLKLRYPFHPLFGTPLEVFGAAGGGRDLVYVRLPNNTTRGIPAWMFDEVICAGVRSAERPTIDCAALLKLAQLLDSWKPDVHSASHEPIIIPCQNASTLRTGPKTASADPGKSPGQRMHSGGDPKQMPAPVAGVASVDCAQRKHQSRRRP